MVETNVWLFYPNLIGYLRIILAMVSFEAMTYAPWRAVICYILSAASDAVDGYVARLYNQCLLDFFLWISRILQSTKSF